MMRWASVSGVGARGLEPPTSWSRTKRATELRYAPVGTILYVRAQAKANSPIAAPRDDQQVFRDRGTCSPMCIEGEQVESGPRLKRRRAGGMT